MKSSVLLKTEFKDLPLFRRGKVRDVYDLGDKLLIVSTDRISCFDVVLPDGIPQKGRVLTSISTFWFEFIKNIIGHHLITADVNQYPQELQKYKADLSERSMLVLKTKPLPVECVVRGYLSGSGWKEYQRQQSVCGITLPQGLKESAQLPEVIFTPSTKADVGHDENVNQKYVENLVGKETAQHLKDISIKIYRQASEHALKKGIIIADTKFEFGKIGDQIILVDEVLTPDSSRFWPADLYKPGKSQPSFDKQYVRDYLISTGWDKNSTPPYLPKNVITETQKKYIEAYEKITSEKFNFSHQK